MNWGQGIAVFLTIFVLFMASLVYLTTQSVVQLEAENYYEQELGYQDRIDALGRGDEIASSMRVKSAPTGIVISADESLIAGLAPGEVNLKRPNDSAMDFKVPTSFSNGQMTIAQDLLTAGKYTMLIRWPSPAGDLIIEKGVMVE